MGGHAWTQEELDRLRRLYPGASWDGLRNAFPGRTRASMQVQAISLNIKRLRDGRTLWRQSEKDRLCALYPRAPWDKICESLPRHPRSAIAKMANALGLRRDASVHSKFPVIQQLRAIRRERGISQNELAGEIGTHAVQIAKWERGENMPRTRTLFDWIEALDLKIALTTAERDR